MKIFFALPLLALALAGCASPDYADVMAQPTGTNVVEAARLHPGDSVVISFDGLPSGENPVPQDKTINDDGTITLSEIGTIKAAGKTTGDLEDVIHKLYVPSFYKHLTVTVKAGDRVFYVNGEVGNKGRQVYVGQITLTKAITSAGGFTDYANSKRVLLIRANGKRFRINCNTIIDGDKPDPGIYPGDQIEVPRRRL